MTLKIRPFLPGDAHALGQIYFQAVREGAAGAYSATERAAWAPAPLLGPDWNARLSQGHTLVALDADGPAGFMTLTDTGHLDLAYVRPAAMGTGLAAQLYAALEVHARAEGHSRLTTDASRLARPFFAKHGWTLIAAQQVPRNGEMLENFRMEKHLTPDPTPEPTPDL